MNFDKIFLQLTISVMLNIYTIFYTCYVQNFANHKLPKIIEHKSINTNVTSFKSSCDNSSPYCGILASNSFPLLNNSNDMPKMFIDAHRILHINTKKMNTPVCIMFNDTKYCKTDGECFVDQNKITCGNDETNDEGIGLVIDEISTVNVEEDTHVEKYTKVKEDTKVGDKHDLNDEVFQYTICEANEPVILDKNQLHKEIKFDNDECKKDFSRYSPDYCNTNNREVDMNTWYTHVRKYIFNL